MNEKLLAWIVLTISGLLEVVWAISMKYSQNFTNLYWSISTLFFLALSMIGLAYSIRTLPVGTAYAVWTGIGAIGTVILGITLFKESVDFWRIFFIMLIVIGIVGLKVVSK